MTEWGRWIKAYEAEWILRGRASKTVVEYCRYLGQLLRETGQPELEDVLSWLGNQQSPACQRQAGRALRSFGKFLEKSGHPGFEWWRQVPLRVEPVIPQETVTEADLFAARKQCRTPREQALIELLWSSGLRRSEISRLEIGDLNLSERWILVRTAKSGRPPRAPISIEAARTLSACIEGRTQGSVFELTPDGIGAMLRRRGWPSAHAWRRGWAVYALRQGVSETSIRTAAGWKSGAMVARYTAALSEDLALHEFGRLTAQAEVDVSIFPPEQADQVHY